MMKQRFIYYFLPMLTILGMLASCSQEEMGVEQGDSPDAQNGEIRFEIGFAPQNGAMQTDAQTRVATDTQFNSTWENGDEIGVYAVKHGEQLANSGNYIHNVKLTYTGDTWTASKGIYWPKDGTKYDFYAYHPYDAAATDPTSIAFNVHTDQSATTGVKSNYSLSDLLMAKNNNSGNGFGKGETVKLSFTHALAMVQVDVSKSMIGDYPADKLKVWLNGCTTDGVLNLSAQSTTPSTNPAPPVMIKMYPCPNDDGALGIYAYRALVPAQEIAAGTVLFSFEYGGGTLLRSKPLAQPLSLVAGTAETFGMTFPFTSATVSDNVRLAGLFTDEELAAITHLRVMGEMTAADFTTIRKSMTSLTSLDLGAATVENDAIPNNAFNSKESLKEFVFPRDIKIIGRDAFDNSGLTGPLTIPQGVTTIGNDAFFRCSGLTGPLTIPEGVTTIGAYAFDSCSGFTGSLTIPESVTTIGKEAFYGCSGFTGSLIIPKGVTTIEPQVFEHCTGFNSLTIPEGVTTIDDSAFEGCDNLTSITCHVLDPGSVTYGSNVFKDIPKNITVSVPETAVDAYQNHNVWSYFNRFQPIQQPNNP